MAPILAAIEWQECTPEGLGGSPDELSQALRVETRKRRCIRDRALNLVPQIRR